MVHILGVKLDVFEHFLAHARDHRKHRFNITHALQLIHLRQIIFQGEALCFDLLLQLCRLLLVKFCLCFLDQGEDITHAEDAGSHTVRMERLEGIEFFALTGKFDRFAGDALYRERCPASRVTIELGQHDAGDVEVVIEMLSHVHGVLTSHRIDDQKDLRRCDGFLDRHELLHQHFVDVQTPGGVDDHDVVAVRFRVGDGVRGDVDR